MLTGVHLLVSYLPSAVHDYYHAARSTTQILVYGTPEYPWSTSILLLIIRILTFSILLRTYFGPWILRLISSRIRIKSISLRSVRGIYFRQGNRILRVERISYAWKVVNGTRRFILKVYGFHLEIGDAEVPDVSPPGKLQAKLAFLSPRPILDQFKRLYAALFALIDPYFRPFARKYAVACLQLAIRCLPAITQAFSLELYEAVTTFKAIPGAKIVAEEISLTAAVEFLQTEQDTEPEATDSLNNTEAGNGVAMWSNKLRDGFRRSLDRAWGSTQGKGSLTFKVYNIEGTMPVNIEYDDDKTTFLNLPGIVELKAGMDFNPRAGTVEPHTLDISLSLDRLMTKVDLLNTILAQLKPRPQPSVSLKRDFNLAPLDLEPRGSSFFSSPRITSAIQSAIPSFASSIFSPGKMSGALSALSPTTRKLLSPNSMKSPTSPFLQALSASVTRTRRRHYIRHSTRLKDEGNVSSLSILKQIQFTVKTVQLCASTASPFSSYSGSIRSVKISVGLADPSKTQFHRQWLGKAAHMEKFDPETYSLEVSLDQIKAEKESNLGIFPVLAVGPVFCEAVAHQWPAPFLVTSPLIRGDPNSAFVGGSLRITSIEATQRLNELRELMESLPTKPRVIKNTPSASNLTPALAPLALPRIVFQVDCGPISTRLLYTTNSGQDLHALDAKTDGFIIDMQSIYQHASPSTMKMFPPSTSVLPVEMEGTLRVHLEPLSVHTRSVTDQANKNTESEDPSVFSAGRIEFESIVRAVAEADGPGGIAVLDRSSILIDSHLRIDSICLELWNPLVLDSVHQFLSLVPPPPPQPEEPVPSTQPPKQFNKPPIGLRFKASLAQCVAFVTAPDINPNDTYELSRGLSFRTGAALEICSIYPHHSHWYEDDAGTDRRTSLLLPLDSVLHNSLAAGKVGATTSQRNSVFLKIQFHHSAVRSLVATPFSPSEPLIVDRLDVPQLPQDFVRVRHIQLEVGVSSGPGLDASEIVTTCNVSAKIPSIRADFKLSHVYSVLLAVQTLESLQAWRSGTESRPSTKSTLAFQFQLLLTSIQIFWTLPKRNMVTRIDSLDVRASSDTPPRVSFSQAMLLVPLPPRVERWQTERPGEWDELLGLQKWEATIILEKANQSVAVTGESARLRIPYGFVFHDLIFDASILAKALKHISHITKAGRFWKFPSPEAEGPKVVPHLSFRLGYLCLEVQDDPFECKLNRIWQIGLEGVKQRIEREDAFVAKVAAIGSGQQQPSANAQDRDYQFDAKHSISIDEARKRLDEVHVIDWQMRVQRLKEVRMKAEMANLHRLYGTHRPDFNDAEPNLVQVRKRTTWNAPLLRAGLHNFNLMIGGPSFPLEELPNFLHTQGSGMPKDTQFSLLIPLHIHFTLTALKITLRDYPIPLFHILSHADQPDKTVFTFDTDLVIAEEMGTDDSTEWHDCPIIDAANALDDEKPWALAVPKTIMPVKTYANPSIQVTSPSPTIFGWGVSYGPAMQDVMRVIETLTSPPQDPSPAMGFWDKLRLILHWKVDLSFISDVQVYLKGSRSPYETGGCGAGFVLAFQGNPGIKIGYENDQKELIQITSELMAIAVPDMDHIAPNSLLTHVTRTLGTPKPFKKTWARLNSGVRFGVGFLPERACGLECTECTGPPSDRNCRLFTFKPHYQILMEAKPTIPETKTADDSYNGFRSDFVHLSFSLESSLQRTTGKSRSDRDYSSLHFTPQLFTHFWSWCSLFDGALGLPVRQGNYYPPKPISPKLGRHMATLKYRISIPNLYVMHAYLDESRETWVDGVTSWVGVKAMVDELQVDMHQREEESTVPGPVPGTTRILRRKPFNAAEVVIKGLDMRALVATFEDPAKKDVTMAASKNKSNYRKHTDLPLTSPSSPWHDTNDFIELDWKPHQTAPLLHLIPVATCPRFSYFKRISASHNHSVNNKFGTENSHICLLDKEPSAPRVQILLASARAAELRRLIRKASNHPMGKMAFDQHTADKMVALLEDYVTLLQDLDTKTDAAPSELQSYFLPSESISPKEWAEFENVYHMHCPSIFMDAAVRDIMMQYHRCSLARKGLEYHMATRAVKFIRDQANAGLADVEPTSGGQASQTEAVNIATSALRKILGTEKTSVEIVEKPKTQNLRSADPMDGWADGVSLSKSHCCLLLKPQIILRGTDSNDTCIVTASQAKLQSYGIMDVLNSDDPVSGKIMSRNYTSLSGMQVFAPTAPGLGNNSIPLEVLIDLRCESPQFERLVPQTDAEFHYDKFNRLRLRNKATLALTNVSASADDSATGSANHLQDQTDLVRVHIPRFTVSANAEHFQAISNVVTKLLLFTDVVHKTRLDRLETMIFTYDFRQLSSAAGVISNLQGRLRDAVEAQQFTLLKLKIRKADEEAERMSTLRIKAHIFLLQEELGLLFDAIKLAQDRFDASAEQNNALLLHASSSEISWRMLDERKNLLAKLVVQDINFHWLNRQDSSTVNHLTVGNLTAFDGSRYAMWAEIISKYDEPSNHPLLKRGLFCLARWTILAPVGGITIYENFELFFHPLRLQIDAKVGHRIMEYVWPARKERDQDQPNNATENPKGSPLRSSMDTPHGLSGQDTALAPPRPRLAISRSFTDLRGSNKDHGFLHKNRSNESVNHSAPQGRQDGLSKLNTSNSNEADVMKTRSTQKSFVFVRVASLNLLLSISKEGSFECRDARIRTKDLEYRNQTWSFEELVNQFIPSNMSWRGWVKMAFHQPLLPVLPVAKELISKTKWSATKNTQVHDSPFKMLHPRMMLTADDDTRLQLLHNNDGSKGTSSSTRNWKNPLRSAKNPSPSIIPSQPLSAEPESIKDSDSMSSKRADGRKRVKSLFSKNKGTPKSKQEEIPDLP